MCDNYVYVMKWNMTEKYTTQMPLLQKVNLFTNINPTIQGKVQEMSAMILYTVSTTQIPAFQKLESR